MLGNGHIMGFMRGQSKAAAELAYIPSTPEELLQGDYVIALPFGQNPHRHDYGERNVEMAHSIGRQFADLRVYGGAEITAPLNHLYYGIDYVCLDDYPEPGGRGSLEITPT